MSFFFTSEFIEAAAQYCVPSSPFLASLAELFTRGLHVIEPSETLMRCFVNFVCEGNSQSILWGLVGLNELVARSDDVVRYIIESEFHRPVILCLYDEITRIVYETLTLLTFIASSGSYFATAILEAGLAAATKGLLLREEPEIIIAVLELFRRLCTAGFDVMARLIPQILEVDFGLVCENAAFCARSCVVDFVLTLCRSSMTGIAPIMITPKFMKAVGEEMEAAEQETQMMIVASISAILDRNGDNSPFTEMVNAIWNEFVSEETLASVLEI
jgi:hypothetical protein